MSSPGDAWVTQALGPGDDKLAVPHHVNKTQGSWQHVSTSRPGSNAKASTEAKRRPGSGGGGGVEGEPRGI